MCDREREVVGRRSWRSGDYVKETPNGQLPTIFDVGTWSLQSILAKKQSNTPTHHPLVVIPKYALSFIAVVSSFPTPSRPWSR